VTFFSFSQTDVQSHYYVFHFLSFLFFNTIKYIKKMAEQEDIVNFCDITGATTEVAKNFLQVKSIQVEKKELRV
jgi:hypothetical protein